MLPLTFTDLGIVPYAEAYRRQCEALESVLAAREAARPIAGTVLFVEHPPTITVTPRPGAAEHILHSAEALARLSVAVVETDRGGDVTYHGPGQIVTYPIIDLNALGIRLHDYMRLLEQAVIATVGAFGIRAGRDRCATGVWVGPGVEVPGIDAVQGTCADPASTAKICAMGVRIRRWITMHGLALNVSTNLSHFDLIIPCGLAGRRVTSMREELAELCPDIPTVRTVLAENLRRAFEDAFKRHAAAQRGGAGAIGAG